MASLCTICSRMTRGFGFKEPRQRVDFLGCASYSSQSLDNAIKYFCSKLCQDIFYDLYTKEKTVNKTDLEIEAEQSVLVPLGDYVARIGLDVSLGAYTNEQIAGLVSTILDSYHSELQTLTKDKVPF